MCMYYSDTTIQLYNIFCTNTIVVSLEIYMYEWGFPGGSVVKNLPANVGDTGSIPESGRFPGEESSNPPQDTRLGNPTDSRRLLGYILECEVKWALGSITLNKVHGGN